MQTEFEALSQGVDNYGNNISLSTDEYARYREIVVHVPDKSSGHRVQQIDIYYNFIGENDFSPEYSKRATA